MEDGWVGGVGGGGSSRKHCALKKDNASKSMLPNSLNHMERAMLNHRRAVFMLQHCCLHSEHVAALTARRGERRHGGRTDSNHITTSEKAKALNFMSLKMN